MDLEEVADELYGLLPGDFVAARTEAARRARAAGDRALAAEVAALGKPSTAAWACNRLVREQPDEIAGLVELGDLLREAQESLAGDQLRALGTQRSRLLAALTRQARVVAARLGLPLSDAVADQVEQTLRAALADPDAGEALLAGRLTGPLSVSGGLGVRPDLRVVPPPRPARPVPERPARPAPDPAAEERRRAEEERRRAEEERRRAAEERRQRELAEAREDAEAAADLAEEAARGARTARERAGRAERRAAELGARVEELAAELARVREEAAAADGEAGTARRRADAAGRAAERAAAERDAAAARVTDLERAGR
ncbi:hypothetical protein ACI78R_07615 [Geodermatophilus sp. SYSU D01106]